MKAFFAKIAGVALATGMTVSAAQADTIRIALAEPPSDEMAAFFVALDRAKANGLDYEWTAFADEELAIQAVLSGDMDIGFGTPYAAMQRSKAPVRIIFQLSQAGVLPGHNQGVQRRSRISTASRSCCIRAAAVLIPSPT